MGSRCYTFVIHGVKWLLKFSRLRGQANGWTYMPRPGGRGQRKILIDTRLRAGSRSQLETILHECLHVSFPTASEEHVTESARDIAIVLYTIGWRLEE